MSDPGIDLLRLHKHHIHGGNMTIKLKLELKWTKIKRVVTVPFGLDLVALNDIIQAMFGFGHDHL